MAKTGKIEDNLKIYLRVKRLSEHAILPTRHSKLAAGYDLYSAYDCVIPSRGKLLVKTDIAIGIPSEHYGRISSRSGLAVKHSIDVGAGVIDEDYRGNVCVLLFNHSDEDFCVKRSDRVAQLILEKISTPDVIEVNHLDETERNVAGFGSTGISLVSEQHFSV